MNYKIMFLFLIFVKLFIYSQSIQADRANLVEEVPSYFDLRDYNGNNYVTEVKKQKGGTCWTHGTMASIESNLLLSGVWNQLGVLEPLDLAEYHLDWWNGFNDHFNQDIYPTSSGLKIHYGGDYKVSAAYLSRGEGAISNGFAQSYDGPPFRFNDDYNIFYIRDIEWFVVGKNLENIKSIKKTIINSGAVATCITSNSRYYSKQLNSHYQTRLSKREPNHSITIVGWDDEKRTQYSKKGAWLCKNSWGESWGDNGYFWVSYYDKHAAQHPEMGLVSFKNSEYMKYDFIYYHDYHGWRDTLTDISEAFNVFIAKGAQGSVKREEYVNAVSFYTSKDNVDYVIKIYKNFEDGNLYDEVVSKSGKIPITGFHTVDLDDPVKVLEDEKFYLYLKLFDGGQAIDKTAEVPVLLGDKGKTVVQSTSNSGESYYFDNSEKKWKDLNLNVNESANFCIKALSVWK